MTAFVSGNDTLVEFCNRRTYRILAALMDFAALVAAWEAAMALRVLLNPIMAKHVTVSGVVRLTPPLGWLVLIWLIAWLVVSQRPESDPSVGSHLLRIFQRWFYSSAVVLALTLTWWHGSSDMSRSFGILYPFCSLVTVLFGRYVALVAAARMEHRYLEPERIGVIGDGPAALAIVNELAARGHSSVHVAGVVRSQASGAGDTQVYPVPVLGTTRELASVINRARISRLILSSDSVSGVEEDHCAVVARRMGISIGRPIRERSQLALVRLTMLGGVPLVEYRPVEFTRRQEMIKRLFDFSIALLLLLALSPLMLLLLVLVKLTSKGPALFESRRVGRGGRHFTFLKFRSMYCGPARIAVERSPRRDGHLFKMRNDPRVTPLGRWLRRYSLDELPQLINVLRGEMSLVGPRPLPAEDLDPDGQSSRFCTWSEERSRAVPGITGLWQVRGRSDIGFEEMMKLDIEYIRNWSLALDFKVLLETPLAVISSRGAY